MSHKFTIDQIAKTCHQANAAICESMGDFSQPQWEAAEPWQQASIKQGVTMHIANPDAEPWESHEAWVKFKTESGWTLNEVKDPVRKTHPLLKAWEELTAEEQLKDVIFCAICKAMIPLMAKPEPQPSKVVEEHPDDIALKMDEDSKPGRVAPKKKRVPTGK